ncbi:glutamate-cysteine ligase-domain-containing protein [Kockovaella imperatae]|uniref:Glutamate--cysteine ligase n=1 Tax=Kockovaella imperatae TaxID=4999 RepID=A0A1Y1UGC8_9TREE|nr:glutamate-cysteine ligase-domain-containing protein [Kockovaella imperatae]ORX37103.1 glutamate-cysteine ligase-domain-containing protein [Kockovaella imperatae]
MGLLALGTPLSWDETKPLAEHIRYHGITQFLNTWDRWKDRTGKGLLWGDEIEYMIVSYDDDNRTALLSLRQTEILKKLQSVTLDPKLEQLKPKDCTAIPTFHPEYGRYMIESTPGCPFTGNPKDLISVEADMRFRRKIIRSHLLPHELPLTVTSWPRLGALDDGKLPFTDPETWPDTQKSSSRSQYVGELLTNPHARFPTLTANIRARRGSLVDIRVPLFIDQNTNVPDTEQKHLSNGIPTPAKPLPGTPSIHMDAMAFGMGCCCLQITFQAWNVDEARRVYDALVPVAPIMLALTAASPAFRGYLADVDARWNVIAASVDDRTEEERGLKPLKSDRYSIPKSRYDSVDLYISNDPRNKEKYHDTHVPMDEGVKQRLTEHGVDNHLASHLAHLFIRDPLVQFSETIDQDDQASMDHFENIQSTNWQTIRFKPPPVNSPIGWRVEFRSMEVQMTDYENAAFSIFIVLLTRAILSFDLNFYMPISEVDDNMQRAQQRDAAARNSFHFRRNVFPHDKPRERFDLTSRPVSPPAGQSPTSPTSASIRSESISRVNGTASSSSKPTTPTGSRRNSGDHLRPSGSSQLRSSVSAPPTPRRTGSSASRCSSEDEDIGEEDETAQMTLDEIINGKGDHFPGLMGVVNAYLNSLNVDVGTKCELRRYLDLIKWRSKGRLVTPANWIRKFITTHPDYKHDSVVSQSITYDLAKAVDEIERGVRPCPELLGHNYVGSGPTGCL